MMAQEQSREQRSHNFHTVHLHELPVDLLIHALPFREHLLRAPGATLGGRSRCASRLRRGRRRWRNSRCRCGSGTRRSSTGRSRTASNHQTCSLPSLIGFFFVSDKKRGTHYRRDLRFSRTCNDHLVTDFREILRINARARINSSRGKNIRDPAGIAAQGHTDDGVVGASFLSKICDLKEAIFRDCDCEQ